jgi:predicted RecB family nuclease
MQLIEDRWVISPQDLVSELECQQRVALNAAVQQGLIKAPRSADPMLQLLQRRGIKHERGRLEALEGARISMIEQPDRPHPDAWSAAWRATESAMLDEFDVIYQATIFTGDFIGFADFLILARDGVGRVLRSQDGRPVYEPVDAKSALSAKRTAALQVGAYAEALTRLGWPQPIHVHLWLSGEGNDWRGPADRFMAVAREVRERLQERLPELTGIPDPSWAPPREACARCRWGKHCDEGRREARDLSLIQGIRSTTRERLVASGIPTIDDMAQASDDDRPARVGLDTFVRLRAQAALQIEGEASDAILWREIDPARLAALPTPSLGDLWFDMEGFPGWDNGQSLEYMFGVGFLDGDEFDFITFEAVDRAQERKAFIDFVDFTVRRLAEFPDMHIYHYADYERRTLLELAQRHGVREAEVDDLVRRGILVDFYDVVRHSLRFSTESLSLKYIEPVYGHQRPAGEEDVTTALGSVIRFEEAMHHRSLGETQEFDAILASIRYYNEDDCLSTYELDRWLRSLTGASTWRTPQGVLPGDDHDATDATDVQQAERLVDRLLDGVPTRVEDRTDDQTSLACLAAMLDFHRREEKPQWWQLFEWAQTDLAALEDEQAVLVVDDADATEWGKTGRQRVSRRRVRLGSSTQQPRDVFDASGEVFLLYDPAPPTVPQPAGSTRGFRRASILGVDRDAMEVEEKEGTDGEMWDDTPIAVMPGGPVNTKGIRQVLQGLGQQIVDARTTRQPWPERVWADLLRGRAPRRSSPFPKTGDYIGDITQAMRDATSYVAVQGPPGTGKTYVGARVVQALAAAGWRIGVVAQSHAVVDNFLAEVHDVDPALPLGKEPPTGAPTRKPWEVAKLADFTSRQAEGFVIGGTVWTFCRQAVQDLSLDLLVIDEAGQFSLTNAVAASQAIDRVLLLGDPQQLPQVSQARHPEPVEVSVLAHISAGASVLPDDHGYFLETTYRMHPRLTEPISKLQYEGKLTAADVTSLRHLEGVDPGVIAVAVEHVGNTTSSSEEADEVVRIARNLIGRPWTDAKTTGSQPPRPLDQHDIIVVAAYNAQVRLIRRRLEEAGLPDIPVGTVDKFQGREAPVVIVSMATSSGEDLPRGIDFLLSPNRLNVAVSRGQWACYLVHSPSLREVAPSSVEGLGYLGAFLGLVTG